MSDIEFTPEQDQCKEAVHDWDRTQYKQVFRIDGVAGSGKTSTVKQTARELKGLTLYATPTGKSAHVLHQKVEEPVSTIHKLIYLPSGSTAGKNEVLALKEELKKWHKELPSQGYNTSEEIEKHPEVKKINSKITQITDKSNTPFFRLNPDSPLREAKRLICDEISMVDGQLAKDLLSFGVPVLVLGDPGQLPPVAGEGYFMQGPADFTLTQIHRQAENSPVLKLATRARLGQTLELGVYGDSSVIKPSEMTPQIALDADQILCGRNATRHANNARMRQLKGFSGPLPKPGEKLVCLRNNHEKGLLNGSLWRVVRCSEYSRRKLNLTVVPEDGGSEITVLAHSQYFRGYANATTAEGQELVQYSPGRKIQRWVLDLQADEKSIGFDMREAEAFTYGSVITVHKCVDPSTLVYTDRGLVPISSLHTPVPVGTADGIKSSSAVHCLPVGQMLKITTRDGYSLTVTPDHKMMSWTGKVYEQVLAKDLTINKFLRLHLGDPFPSTHIPCMPPSPLGDIREKRYTIPTVMTEDLAELLGLIVADGTVFKRGFRLVKRHLDVVERFSSLCYSLFQVECKVNPTGFSNAWQGEVNSTQLARWLLTLGGVTPCAKGVPDCILQSPVSLQTKFLRGMFEDGSVSLRDSSVELTTHAGPEMASKLQLLLLRAGVISRASTYASQAAKHIRLHVQGSAVQVFKTKIGFVSKFKNDRLAAGSVMSDMRKRVPDPLARTKATNWRSALYTSRELADPSMLGFHHDQIESIVPCTGPSMCLTVPDYGRFLQNGFDGCNSQGSQWNNVLVLDESRAFQQYAKNHLYTAVTRACERVTVVRL